MSYTGTACAVIGITFYFLLNWSYTTAVFTPPGSTASGHHAYSSLPSHEPGPAAFSFTVKSTGEYRFCKKCKTRKPDRAHHCSTCGRCVLKMDHHCPWLATCVGLRNYKPFVLFLVYTCLFCYTCFAISAKWVWGEIVGDTNFGEDDRLMPVNYVLLAVLSGILGIVLTGFTGWHLYLATQGTTTIESLEKTRYLSPVHKSMKAQLSQQRRNGSAGGEDPSFTDQLREIHANALPSVTRPEEGEDELEGETEYDQHRSSPARSSLRQTYAEMENQRERDRYDSYLDELDSEKLPNAFDHGWRRNLKHVFGETPVLWFLPICNTTGDGWQWEVSSKWEEAAEEAALARREQRRKAQEVSSAPGWIHGAHPHSAPRPGPYANGYGDNSVPRSDVSTQTLGPRGPPRDDDGQSSSDDDRRHASNVRLMPHGQETRPGQWNDLPADMVNIPARGPSRGGTGTRSPRPARAYPDR